MPAVRRCLYEILGIERDADDSQIKKAYRQQALVNHPDKNPDCQQEAAELFKQVQHAYDVLSDTHERAWYDSHRLQILRGNDTLSNSDEPASPSAATDVDLFAYFASTCYEGFGAGSTSFFRVYGDAFDQLWTEETEAATEANVHLESAAPFGGYNAEWETVRGFYRQWEGFISVKSFSFADKWKLSEAPNREYRRAMERDNKKERARLKKEFVATIRELVAFVKKRDPRVAARQQKELEDRQQREIELKQREKQRAEERKNMAEQTRAARDQALEEDGEALDEILASIALDERLERKKKKNAMNANLSDSDTPHHPLNGEPGCDPGASIPDNATCMGTMDNGSQHTPINDAADIESDHSSSSGEPTEDDLYCVACRKLFRTSAQKVDHERSKKHKVATTKLRKQMQKNEEEFMARKAAGAKLAMDQKDTKAEDKSHIVNSEEDALGMDKDDGEAFSDPDLFSPSSSLSKKKQKKKKRRQNALMQQTQQQQMDGMPQHENGAAEDSTIDEMGAGSHDSDHSTDEIKEAIPDTSDGHGKEGVDQGVGLSKKERRRLKQKKKEVEASSKGKSLQCNACSAKFPSRTKLMKHVNDSGHALHVDSTRC